MNKTVYVVSNGYKSDLEGNVTKVISYLSQKLHEVPEPYRESARIEIESYCDSDDDAYTSFMIYYVRPETEEEKSAREYGQARAKELQEKREREQFERLKAKFEGKKED